MMDPSAAPEPPPEPESAPSMFNTLGLALMPDEPAEVRGVRGCGWPGCPGHGARFDATRLLQHVRAAHGGQVDDGVDGVPKGARHGAVGEQRAARALSKDARQRRLGVREDRQIGRLLLERHPRALAAPSYSESRIRKPYYKAYCTTSTSTVAGAGRSYSCTVLQLRTPHTDTHNWHIGTIAAVRALSIAQELHNLTHHHRIEPTQTIITVCLRMLSTLGPVF